MQSRNLAPSDKIYKFGAVSSPDVLNRRLAHEIQFIGLVCGKFACLSDAPLCIVVQKG